MRNGYGGQDRDKVGKEKSDAPLKAFGPAGQPEVSSEVGGVSNLNSPPATKPGSKAKGSFPFAKAKGGTKTSNSGTGGGLPIAEHKPGGFRNNAMANRR